MPPRHIVLDIGRVLLVWDPEIPYRRLIPDEAERRRFLAEVCSPEWNACQDAGRTFADGEAELVARFPGQEALIRAFSGTGRRWCPRRCRGRRPSWRRWSRRGTT